MKFDKEFKDAIKNLPKKEKDKLLLRLLKKDIPLVNRLYFELISTDNVEDRRKMVEEQLLRKAEFSAERYYKPGVLLMDIRDLSGIINEHVYTTKDKFGEIYLNIIMLNKVLQANMQNLNSERHSYIYKLVIYIISKIFRILILIKAIHVDYHLEFEKPLAELGRTLAKSKTLIDLAIKNGLDINWLLSFNIPDDIKEIHKNIRELGFLR